MSKEPDAVALAFVHNGREVAFSWFESIFRMTVNDSRSSRRVARGGYFMRKAGTDGLGPARNAIVRDFLEDGDGTPWLLFVDTDAGFAVDTVDRLVASADPVQRPVVGALCFAQQEADGDGMGGYRPGTWPVVMDWRSNGFVIRWNYERDALTRVDGTGSHCILIHRSVFEKVRDYYQDRDRSGTESLFRSGLWMDWYSRMHNPVTGELVSEDLSFCLRLRELGIPVHVDTRVRTTHMKPVWLSEEGYVAERAAKFLPPRGPAVEPATEKVAVVVPVLKRPKNARPFMESLRATDPTGLCTVYAVADEDDPDTAQAWRDAGATVLVDSLVTFPKKANLGYRETREPWLFLTGDDVRFHPGWLDQAMAVHRRSAALVVGTNDLGNPRVARGEHATHMLIRREYIDTIGASWDGPGVLCHEGYRHLFVDNELVEAAKRRRTFAAALFSVVEHLHPLWGRGEIDEVYELPEAFADADRTLFASRLTAQTAN